MHEFVFTLPPFEIVRVMLISSSLFAIVVLWLQIFMSAIEIIRGK